MSTEDDLHITEQDAIWAYNLRNGNGPVLLQVREWSVGDQQGLKLEHYFFHEEDMPAGGSISGDSELCRLQGWLENPLHFAKLVVSGALRRVGSLPELDKDELTPGLKPDEAEAARESSP